MSISVVNRSAAQSAAVVTVSDGVAQGTRPDDSGAAVAEVLRQAGFNVTERRVVADDRDAVVDCLLELVAAKVQLVCTTGGTGFGPRDITPEATTSVIERPSEGLPQLMRSAGLHETRYAALSRATAGIAQRSLIVNLPGSPRGARTSLTAILDLLPHALELIAGHTQHQPREG